MNNPIIAPSLMCADWSNIKKELNDLQNAGINMFHLDIMDGYYVPNHALSLNDVRTVRKNTNALIDVHLMVEDCEKILDLYLDEGIDIIYVHYETTKHLTRTLLKIKESGSKVGIVLNPHQSINLLDEVLSLVDVVMIMTVNPGFAGQKFVDITTTKIKKLCEHKKNNNFQIAVDGAISKDKIVELGNIGVDIFVVGTSFLFGKKESYKELIESVTKA